MADADTTGSPLEAAAGTVDSQATEAFALLGNETRLAVLLALWEVNDPPADDWDVAFSRIFERVDYDDPGNLRYHLEKLEGQFIRHTEGEGYELRVPGLKLVRAVIAGAGVQDETREAAEIDQPCPFCEAPTAISYREGVVFWACTECEGPTPGRTDDGLLTATLFEPAGVAGRSPEELRAASMVAIWRRTGTLFDGLCPACSGPVDGWLEGCSDHAPTGVCEDCGTRAVAWVRFQCRVCKNFATTTPKALALYHPAVVAFYHDHGVSMRVHADDFESVKRVYQFMHDHDIELVAEDPPRVAVTAALDGDEVRLTFDEGASVVDVRR
jgi:hypothetical protein